MVSEARVKKFQALIEKTPTLIRVKVTTRSAGTPYSDAAQGEECWDIYSSSENDQKVIIRHSFKIHFHYKPTFVAGKIDTNMQAA